MVSLQVLALNRIFYSAGAKVADQFDGRLGVEELRETSYQLLLLVHPTTNVIFVGFPAPYFTGHEVARGATSTMQSKTSFLVV